MNFKRAIIMPMYGAPRKCWLCGRMIDKGIASCHFFDFDVKAVRLRLFHAHEGCARRAGLVKTGVRWKVSQHDFMKFWLTRCKLADLQGDVNFSREYGMMHEPWPHNTGLSEQEVREWDALRAKISSKEKPSAKKVKRAGVIPRGEIMA